MMQNRKNLRISSRGENKMGLESEPQQQANLNPYDLNIVNLSQDENSFGSSIKLDLLQLQDEINQLDFDGKLRKIQQTEFNKPYINVIRKWLKQNAEFQSKDLLEQKINSQIDINLLLQKLQVKNPNDGLKKLHKFLVILDSIVTKITELEMITFLKYDDLFGNLVKNQGIPSNSKINQLNAGIFLNRFQICQANLERQSELFIAASKLNQQNSSTSKSQELQFDLKKIQTVEDILSGLKSNVLRVPEQESQTIQNILNQAIEKEVQLVKSVDLAQQQVEKLKESYQKLKDQFNEVAAQTLQKSHTIGNIADGQDMQAAAQEYYVKIIEDLTATNKQSRLQLETEFSDLKKKHLEQSIKYSESQTTIKDLQGQIESLSKEKDRIYKEMTKPFRSVQELQDGYEACLRDEMENLRVGYENKIGQIYSEIDDLKRIKGKEILELKQELKTIEETKKLLMKKLSIFIKT